MVSANLSRTIRSCRQAVLDARRVLDWLKASGYDRLGVLGCSLGSSIATIVAAHDERVNATAMLLLASRFGNVVWTSRATRHIRRAMDRHITLDELDEVWSLLSPISYMRALRSRDIPVLVVSAREDAVFQPYLTEEIMAAYRDVGIRHEWRRLPCGHYTLGNFPFSLYVLLAAIRFFRKHL
jgi:pimeloyl-ACP methyl ester carboxylesterase